MKDGSGKFSCDCNCHVLLPKYCMCCEECYQNHGISLRSWKNYLFDVRKDGIQPSN